MIEDSEYTLGIFWRHRDKKEDADNALKAEKTIEGTGRNSRGAQPDSFVEVHFNSLVSLDPKTMKASVEKTRLCRVQKLGDMVFRKVLVLRGITVSIGQYQNHVPKFDVSSAGADVSLLEKEITQYLKGPGRKASYEKAYSQVCKILGLHILTRHLTIIGWEIEDQNGIPIIKKA